MTLYATDAFSAWNPNPSRSDSSKSDPPRVLEVTAYNLSPSNYSNTREGRFSENGGCGYVLKPSIMNEDLFVAGEKPPTTPQVSQRAIRCPLQIIKKIRSSFKNDFFAVTQMRQL
ncbi:hypothetical protein COOONC_18933 [Cooperia oncophora]